MAGKWVLSGFVCGRALPRSRVGTGNGRRPPLYYYYSAVQPEIDSKIIKSNRSFLEDTLMIQ